MSVMTLKCENLVKQYKDKRALDNVSLTLEKGKIYGLIGRNGAGKTTLLSEHLLDIFHLDRKKRISKLSKGMTSMITIIVALASKADFTLLDEPVAGLDVVAREQFYRILLEEYTETGRTFVISTHIIEEAADLFEEVIILHEGKMVLKENTQELLESCVHVSGREEDVDAATAGLTKYREETIGRSKSVTVKLEPGQRVEAADSVSVQPMNLQKIFVAMCGGEV